MFDFDWYLGRELQSNTDQTQHTWFLFLGVPFVIIPLVMVALWEP